MMIPDAVTSIIVSGTDLEYILFKCAFYYAEQGLSVWFISPSSFKNLPKEITPPDKDVLKLITFLYLDDHKELINQLNGIHIWHHLPNVLILNCYEHYCCLTSNNDNKAKAPVITALLLDAVSTCSCKNSRSSLFLAGLNDKECSLDNKLKILLNLYFEHLVELNHSDQKDSTLDHIISLANLV